MPPGGHMDGAIEVRMGRGRLAIELRDRGDAPALYLVRAFGVVNPGLIRRDVELAAEFAEAHPEGWDYVADPSGVRVANPANLFWLRHVRHLPHLRRYVVVAPRGWQRVMSRVVGRLIGVTAVVPSIEDATSL